MGPAQGVLIKSILRLVSKYSATKTGADMIATLARPREPRMTAETPTTNQETWRDWLGPDEPDPDELLTRDEIVQRANGWLLRGRKIITARDLRLWEQLGILPRGIRRGHKGASRNLYPGWMVALARDIREMQHQGLSLDAIRPRIRNRARIEMNIGSSPIDDDIRAHRRFAQAPEDITMSFSLIEELERLAEWRARLTGVETDRIEVRVIGRDKSMTIYRMPIAQHDENPTSE